MSIFPRYNICIALNLDAYVYDYHESKVWFHRYMSMKRRVWNPYAFEICMSLFHHVV